MLAAGVELGDRYSFDLVHGHDWLVANACDHLAKRFEAPLVTTIHATEHGRTRAGSTSTPRPTSTGSSAGSPTAPTA